MQTFLALALFAIPYFFFFSWVDDKRRSFRKDDDIYPRFMTDSSVAVTPSKVHHFDS